MARIWKPEGFNALFKPFICHDEYNFGGRVFPHWLAIQGMYSAFCEARRRLVLLLHAM
jgi:hypothetical protein